MAKQCTTRDDIVWFHGQCCDPDCYPKNRNIDSFIQRALDSGAKLYCPLNYDAVDIHGEYNLYLGFLWLCHAMFRDSMNLQYCGHEINRGAVS